MNKVICDICGTSYPENAEQCPICGYAPGFEVEPLADDEEFVLDDALLEDVALNEDTAEDAEDADISVEPVVQKNQDSLETDDDDDEEAHEEDSEKDEQDEEQDDAVPADS